MDHRRRCRWPTVTVSRALDHRPTPAKARLRIISILGGVFVYGCKLLRTRSAQRHDEASSWLKPFEQCSRHLRGPGRNDDLVVGKP